MPLIPFSKRLQKNKLDKEYAKFLEVFKKLKINISFADILAHMPTCWKFMKKILTKNLDDQGTSMSINECSTILRDKLAPKPKDSGGFRVL